MEGGRDASELASWRVGRMLVIWTMEAEHRRSFSIMLSLVFVVGGSLKASKSERL